MTPPSRDRPDSLPAKVASAVERLARARRSESQAVATRHGLTTLQLDLLGVLAHGPPPDPSVGRLAAEVGVTQPTATDSLRTLVDKGLAERRRDPADGRRSTIELTGAGRRLAEEVARADDQLVTAVASLPPDVQEAALEALLAIIARLVHTGAIDVARTCLTCHHHRQDGATHHCTLLDIELPPAELRVNCPDHRAA